jgi:hypothetical protein
MNRLALLLLVGLVIGCGQGASTSGERSPREAPNVPVEEESSEIEPDPITRPLSEADARSEATRHAERTFAEARPTDASGRPVERASFAEADWNVEQRSDGWTLRNEPPTGEWAIVRFGLFGENPQVEVGFASQ